MRTTAPFGGFVGFTSMWVSALAGSAIREIIMEITKKICILIKILYDVCPFFILWRIIVQNKIGNVF